MSRSAGAGFGVLIQTRKEAEAIDQKFHDDAEKAGERPPYFEIIYFPGSMSETRVLFLAEDSLKSTMNESCVTLDTDQEWVETFKKIGLTGSWWMWCS